MSLLQSPEKSELKWTLELAWSFDLLTATRINVSFIDKDGTKLDFQVSEGDNLLDIAQANDLEMEGV